MERRLAHKMKEEILHLPAQAVGKNIKLLRSHKLFSPFRLVAERAGKIAYVRYFEIGFVDH